MRPSYCAQCNGVLDPYLPDCPSCGAQVHGDPDAHHDRELRLERDSGGRAVAIERKWKLHVPWGLFIILGLYTAAAFAYIQYSDSVSPINVAAEHLLAAQKILGSDNGETASAPDLQLAYGHLVEALTLTPNDQWAETQLDKVTWALAKMGKKPPMELKRRADFLAAAWEQEQKSRSTVFPESPRERFGLDDFGDKTGRLQRFLGIGGVVFILLWLYREFQEYKFLHKRDDEHELLRRDELRALDSHRRR